MKLSTLIESTFFKGDLQGYNKHDIFSIKILKNPSVLTLKHLLNKDDVRGLLCYDETGGEEFYFWEAKLMNHDLFEQNFDLNGVGFILQKDSILFNYYKLHPEEYLSNEEEIENEKEDINTVLSSYFVNKLYPNGYKIGVSY